MVELKDFDPKGITKLSAVLDWHMSRVNGGKRRYLYNIKNNKNWIKKYDQMFTYMLANEEKCGRKHWGCLLVAVKHVNSFKAINVTA